MANDSTRVASLTKVSPHPSRSGLCPAMSADSTSHTKPARSRRVRSSQSRKPHDFPASYGLDDLDLVRVLARRKPKLRVALQDVLFREGDIVEHGEQAEEDEDKVD